MGVRKWLGAPLGLIALLCGSPLLAQSPHMLRLHPPTTDVPKVLRAIAARLRASHPELADRPLFGTPSLREMGIGGYFGD